MKTIFINAISKNEPDYEKIILAIKNIDEKQIAICYSNQFVKVANGIKKRIENQVTDFIQILGCSNPKFSKETKAILIIGEGKFHTVSLAYESKLPTYVLGESLLWKVSKKEIKKMINKEKGMILRYLNSDRVGIMVTTKPGQERLIKAREFKSKLKNKKGYIFLANNLNVSEFDNFGMDCWVNTACPRMDLEEGPIINLDKLNSVLNNF